MFRSVLIANRGEIACRIALTARRLGMRTIAVHSDADASARHVSLCDEAIRIGAAAPRESYLAIDRVIEAGRRAGADCVHPGYGFLAENPSFAEAVAAAGMTFIGPPAEAIRAMGLKDAAKALMEKAGVPVVPGYHGERQDPAFLRQKAYEIGYPVLIKPVAGGGGKGMRRVDRHADFEAALEGAMREAASAFGDARVLIEKFVTAPRHVEVQVFADRHGGVIHLNERDCSLQRRHQKVIEEAPAPGLGPELREIMGAAAIAAARAVGYEGAGTVEFIADGAAGLREGGFWFMEMNTRLQVEHPVTEQVTGLDLVEWQFRIADGERLPLAQADVPLRGHAVEARLYAEDPARGFVPSPGRIVALDLPAMPGLRIDSGVEQGMEVSPHYDPMIAKLIAHAPTRGEALDLLASGLDQTIVAGPRTNASFLAALCRADAFRAGRIDTGFIDQHLAALGAVPQPLDNGAAAAGAAALLWSETRRRGDRDRQDGHRLPSPWAVADGFSLGGARISHVAVIVEGTRTVARLAQKAPGIGDMVATLTIDGVEPAPEARVFLDGDTAYVLRQGLQTIVRADSGGAAALLSGGDGVVRAPMHGRLAAVLVQAGDVVEAGQRVAVIEAMKMEHTLTAPCAGDVVEVNAGAGTQLAEGAPILRVVTRPAKTG